jgi:alginate O-acetyltransferase complex protein AlgI
MLFSSLIFLFAFLPIVLITYYIVPKKGKNIILMLSSLFFYAWGGFSLTAVLLISILGNYLFGIWVNATKDKTKLPLAVGVIFNLLLLGTFKYGNFIVENINIILSNLGSTPLKDPGIILPLGISFFTFQAMSYLIDVYRNETPVQKNLFYLALYISFFPQLIAGPIVRYHDLAPQLTKRTESFAHITKGIERLILGLVKKVIVANQFAIIAKEVYQLPTDSLPQSLAWIGAVSYSFQVYFDLSGYSDMAIGLGLLFGFKIPENFNFPYVATSIREFWKRWHITLGKWLASYLYIPLGGSRKGNVRTYINLFIVFIVCGFWHGANWNFLVWGLIHGFFMTVERLWFEKNVLNRIPKVFSIAYMFLTITLARVFFETSTFNEGIAYTKVLFAGNSNVTGFNISNKLVNPEFLVIAVPAILGSFGFYPWIKSKLDLYLPSTFFGPKMKTSLKTISILASIVVVTILLISDTYNPFIYFRF